MYYPKHGRILFEIHNNRTKKACYKQANISRQLEGDPLNSPWTFNVITYFMKYEKKEPGDQQLVYQTIKQLPTFFIIVLLSFFHCFERGKEGIVLAAAGTPYIFVLERVLTFVLFDIFIAIKIVCTHPMALCVSISRIKGKYFAKCYDKRSF